jgi:phosphoribosyl-ATP pyrophosphohydrolase
MKKLLIYISSLSLIVIAPLASAFGGNEDRAGSAGANELLINPWARSSGWGGANTSMIKGVEATSLNVAGLALNKGTEVTFAHTNWLKGSDITINSFGIAQKVGEEATETIIAALSGDAQQVTAESADLIFHLLILLRECGVSWDDVLAELDRREGVSGLVEKAARSNIGE